MDQEFINELKSAVIPIKEAELKLIRAEQWWNEVSLGCRHLAAEFKDHLCLHLDVNRPRCHYSVCPMLWQEVCKLWQTE